MGDLVPLRSATIDVQAAEAQTAFVDAVLSAVDHHLDGIDRGFQTQGIPSWLAARIEVRLSDALRAALSAEGAFELVVSVEDKNASGGPT